MDITVTGDGWLVSPHGRIRCALGRSGLKADKREGDGATPIGTFPLREVFYRPDKVEPPRTTLPLHPITQDMGWCDDPAHPDYNRLVQLPFDGSHELMWRSDHLYDLLAVLGYNDNPVEPNRGSAIFLHVASDGYGPTEGCVAIRRDDLMDILSGCTAARVTILPPASRSTA